MNVTVNPDRCMGHGQCFAYAPAVYESDDDGYCVVVEPDADGDLLRQAVEDAGACPEGAITVESPK